MGRSKAIKSHFHVILSGAKNLLAFFMQRQILHCVQDDINRFSFVFTITLIVLFIFSPWAFASFSPWDDPQTRSNGANEIITSVPEIFGLGLIRGYQTYISPLLRLNKCNFTPSCSNYGLQAIKKYGAGQGMVMAFERISRDHPWAWEEKYEVENGRLADEP